MLEKKKELKKEKKTHQQQQHFPTVSLLNKYERKEIEAIKK